MITVVWRGTDAWRSEAVELELGDDGLRARAVQVGADPVAYRLDYELEAGPDWRTRRLGLTASGTGFRRRLELEGDGDGAWTLAGEAQGGLDGAPEPGGDPSGFAGALDCDLAFSPLTNLMPIRRSGLAEVPGELDLVCAWVAVPELTVTPYPQRYEHVEAAADRSVVRFVDRGPFEGFVAELVLDRDGLVLEYPGLAERV